MGASTEPVIARRYQYDESGNLLAIDDKRNYNRFRYYDADCGRYVSLDPIGLAGGVNSYKYAPNPSGWTDPLGLSKTCECDFIATSNGDVASPAGLGPKKLVALQRELRVADISGGHSATRDECSTANW